MKRRLYAIALGIVAILFASGCSNLISLLIATPTPTVTSTPTETPTDTPTPIFSPTPSRTSTITQTPTITPTPTRTRTPTPSPTPTKWSSPPSGHINRIDLTFHSNALNLDRQLIIYLPPGYDAQSTRRYPVLYVLHGFGGYGNPSPEWEQWGLKDRAEEMMNSGALKPVIIVQPDGFMPVPAGQPSLFFNHAPELGGGRWGDYIWQDVVGYIDSKYRTIVSRTSRAIGGFSFGGQGALSLGLLHPEIYGIVGAHSPSFRSADNTIYAIGNDVTWFNQYDPIWLVENKDTAKDLTLWMDVALSDDKVRGCGAGSDRCVEAFHVLLVSKGIPHEWHDQWPGGHEGPTYWGPHILDYLQWYSSVLVGQ
ncbi:MAG TPA: alpha/beta hydrolase-fold protein [Anaerolineae bacterium]